MLNDWDEIISFYQRLEKGDFLVNKASMVTLIKLMIDNRDVIGLYPLTSLSTLCISRYKTYEEGIDKPMFTVVAASQEYYKFSLIEPIRDGEVYREKIETICCRLERALEAFDEMVAKLRKFER